MSHQGGIFYIGSLFIVFLEVRGDKGETGSKTESEGTMEQDGEKDRTVQQGARQGRQDR